MPIVANQPEKDLVIWQEWVNGRKQSDLAEQYGCTQQNISASLKRARNLIPVEDKEQYLLRALARLDRLYAIFQPLTEQADKGAARIVLMTMTQEGRYLGLDSPAKLELFTAERQVDRVDIKAELAVLLQKIKAEQDERA